MKITGTVISTCPKCGGFLDKAHHGPKCLVCGEWPAVPAPIDPITKLRRRVEDVLRKSTPEKIQEVAQVLGVR